MSEVVYEVLTEFVFDTREAITNSETLRSAVDRISSAADGALFSLNRVGEFLSHGLGANLSVMGTLGAALHTFEHFAKTRLTFANIIGSNMENLVGNVETFNDRLEVSQGIMKQIAKVAREYSLDETAMASSTKMLAALLTPMGLSGKNMSGAVNMARMYEKSAPVLGVDTSQTQGELVRLISGQASMGDTLFRRLVSDTKPFAQYRSMMQNPMMMHHSGGGPAQMFNMMPMEKRWAMINKAMEQFSSDADVVAGNAGLLSNKLRAMKNELIGIDGILIPFGQVLTDQIRPILEKVMDFLETYGRPALEKFSVALKGVFEHPERLYASLRQMQQLRDDLPKAITLMHAFDTVLFGLWIAKMPMVNTALRMVGTSLSVIGGQVLSFLGITLSFKNVMGVMTTVMSIGRFIVGGLIFVLQRFLAPLAVFMGILQVISRAKGYAEAEDAKALMDKAKPLGGTLVQLGQIALATIKPIDDLVDSLARGIAPLFEWNKYLSVAADNMGIVIGVADYIHNTIVSVIAIIEGVLALVGGVLEDVLKIVALTFENLKTVIFDWSGAVVQRVEEIFSALASGNVKQAANLLTTPTNMPNMPGFPDMLGPGDLLKRYTSTVDDVMGRNIHSINDPKNPDKNVANHVTNIGSVNIRQDFKENQEPDRIAHSFVKTIQDLAVNPRQAAGRSFAGALTR